MCYNCGCQNPEDNMGDPNNITENTLAHLSEHWGKSLPDTKKELLNLLQTNDPKLEQDPHLKEMFDKATHAWGQSLNEAKTNVMTLLQKEVNQNG